MGVGLTAGRSPYDGSFEYPPLAVVPMLLAALPGDLGPEAYTRLWAVGAAVVAGAIGLSLAWIAGRSGERPTVPEVLVAWAILATVLAPVLTWRFDGWAIALALLGISLTIAGRPGPAGIAIGAGALVKIFPIAFAPILAMWLWMRPDRAGALRLVGASVGTIAAVMLALTAAVGFDRATSFVDYQADRLVQLESLAASVLMIGHVIAAVPIQITYGHASLEVVGPGVGPFSSASQAILVAAVLVVTLLAFLRFRSSEASVASLVAWLVAVAVAVLLADKVFSAQFVLWALPLAALLPRPGVALAIGAAALTTLLFPVLYHELVGLAPPAILLLVSRNALLLALLAWLVVRYGPPRRDRTS